MRNFLFLLCLSFLVSPAWCQDESAAARITDSIVAEGKRLYRSEMASWYGTDIFLGTFKDRSGKAGGYFSYSDQKVTHCIFFSDADTPVVLATMTFDSTFKVANATIDGDSRSFTTVEKDLYTIRQLAAAEIRENKDFFKMYENSSFNVIPLISNGEKKVYVLTGPKVNGVVIFGNDYLLRFDKDNQLVEKRQLHKNIISIKYGKDEKEESTGWHTHLPETGDFITASDICTLMLYEKFAGWRQHYVTSKNYISIWDCEKDDLFYLTTEAWEKIQKDQKERNKE